MIVKMRKFTLLAFEAHKSNLLKELQRFGEVHFKNLQKDETERLEFLQKDLSGEGALECEAELDKIKFAVSMVEPYASKPKGLKAMTVPPAEISFDEFDAYLESYDYNKVYAALKEADEKIASAKAEISKLKAENENLNVWRGLDVAPSEFEKTRYVKSVIGTVSRVSADSFKKSAEESFKAAYIEFLGQIKDDMAVLIMVFADEFDETFAELKNLGFARISLNFSGVPKEIIKANEKEIERLKKVQDEAQKVIRGYGGEYDNLKIAGDCLETALERERVRQNFLKMKTVTLIEGWVPEENAQNFKNITAGVCGNSYYLEETEVEKDSEEVPIKLKNNKMVSAFEEVTTMFSLPRYNEIDPTPLHMPFYMLFFGLMLGDAGYGLIMIAGAWAALKFLYLKPGTRNFLRFFFYLGFTTVLGGMVYDSFFGLSFFTPIAVGDGTYKAILNTQTDVMQMMIVSVALGIFQVLFGIGVKGYMLLRDGKPWSAVFDSLFWIIALLSGCGMLLGSAGVVPESISPAMSWTFLISLIALAATQGRENASLGAKIGGGLYSVYGISGYVGDFVSYTRIAALALAGAYISFSFNLMASLFPDGAIKIVAGAIIIVLGQALNFGLSALGAYVHTCRLQYVEYFGKFFEGGGVPFNGFKLKNDYIQIKK